MKSTGRAACQRTEGQENDHYATNILVIVSELMEHLRSRCGPLFLNMSAIKIRMRCWEVKNTLTVDGSFELFSMQV